MKKVDNVQEQTGSISREMETRIDTHVKASKKTIEVNNSFDGSISQLGCIKRKESVSLKTYHQKFPQLKYKERKRMKKNRIHKGCGIRIKM